MKLDSNSFDVDNYVSKLITFMGGRHLDSDEPDLNWKAIGRLAAQFTNRVPTSDFMWVYYKICQWDESINHLCS